MQIVRGQNNTSIRMQNRALLDGTYFFCFSLLWQQNKVFLRSSITSLGLSTRTNWRTPLKQNFVKRHLMHKKAGISGNYVEIKG
jgi:hypothetical protein